MSGGKADRRFRYISLHVLQCLSVDVLIAGGSYDMSHIYIFVNIVMKLWTPFWHFAEGAHLPAMILGIDNVE